MVLIYKQASRLIPSISLFAQPSSYLFHLDKKGEVPVDLYHGNRLQDIRSVSLLLAY